MALDPLVGAISAGNTVVIKPSELSPETSAFLARTIPAYLDRKAIKVIEGGTDIAENLLQQKWDKIFFTGMISDSSAIIYSFNPVLIILDFTQLTELHFNNY